MAKAVREYGIKWEDKALLDSDYLNDLSFVDKNVRKITGFLEILKVQGV